MQKINLNSKRLSLRLITILDLNEIHKLHYQPETDEFNALGIPADLDETKNVITPWIAENKLDLIKNYTFAIENNLTKEFIGLFGLKVGSVKYRKAEIWYKIVPKFWGSGFATEAVNLVVDFSFDELKLHRIEAGCAVENIGSMKVLEKCGFQKEGRGRQILPLKNGWSDNYEYAILDTDERFSPY